MSQITMDTLRLNTSSFLIPSGTDFSYYKKLLEECWQKHLASRAEDAPTVISLFAGCGGSSLGYSMAGYKELLMVEWDEHAMIVFKKNFPDVKIIFGDICKLSVENCLESANIKTGDLDVLDGSPPCQGFSFAGKRNGADPRNFMFEEYVRLLKGLQPKAFVMENVYGMAMGKSRKFFLTALSALKECGYNVDVHIINAAYLNVPQRRRRLIFIGVRNDINSKPSFPRPNKISPTLFHALYDMKKEQQAPPPFSPAKLRLWEQTRKGARHDERYSVQRLSWNKTPPTLLRIPGSGGLLHPDEPRNFSTEEHARIQSFPDDFQFMGSWLDNLHCIGNSVPPLFMMEIAKTIREKILLNS